MVLADIPGLIEGAHEGVGLGYAFLRHIQRTRVLIHVLDGMAEDPLADFSQINSELSLFDPMLGKKPQIVVYNKMDLPEVQERWESILADLEARGYHRLSSFSPGPREPATGALEGPGIAADRSATRGARYHLPVYKPAEDPRAFTVEQDLGWLAGARRCH